MYLNHPTIAYRDLEFRRLLLLAQVTEVQCGTGVRWPLAGGPTIVAAMRGCLGSALVAFRQRLEGAALIGRSSTATASSGASS